MQRAILRVSMLLCWALAGSLHELRAADEAATELKSRAGHSMPIEWATWSPDGTRIATAARDRQILIWDVQSGAILQRMVQHDQAFGRPIWSADGSRLMDSAGAGYMACVWNVATGKPVLKLLDYQNHPKSGWLNANGTQAIFACDNGTIGHWDVTTGESARRVAVESEEV